MNIEKAIKDCAIVFAKRGKENDEKDPNNINLSVVCPDKKHDMDMRCQFLAGFAVIDEGDKDRDRVAGHSFMRGGISPREMRHMACAFFDDLLEQIDGEGENIGKMYVLAGLAKAIGKHVTKFVLNSDFAEMLKEECDEKGE